jgi:aspartate racemase
MTTDKQRTAGVLGGMGPDATVDFMASVIKLAPASKDQDHVHMIVDHNPQVPDRQAAMRGDSAPVNAALIAMARRLETAGADFLVMPCNTAHAFLDGIEDAVGIPLIHIIDETVREIDSANPLAKQIGVLATSACIEADLYQQAIARSGREAVLLNSSAQSVLMDLIMQIKSGDRSTPVENAMARLAGELVRQGAELIIAGCTEIPLVLQDALCAVPVLSSTAVLARRTVALATGKRSLAQ